MSTYPRLDKQECAKSLWSRQCRGKGLLRAIATKAVYIAAATGILAATASAQDVVRIGVIGPLTGDLAYAGQFQLKGAQLKAEELNAIQKNVKYEVISEDDESKCDRAVAAATKLINRDRVHALLGAWQSTCTLAIVPITRQAEVPQYTTSVASPITTQGSKWIFRVALQTARLNDATIRYARDKLGKRRFAILSSNEEVGKSFAATSTDVLKNLGLQPVAKEEYTRGDKDFSGQLGRIRAANPDALIVATGFQEPAIIARQARELGLSVQLLGGDTVPGNPKFVDLGGDGVVGLIFATVFLPDEQDERLKPFLSAYKKRFNEIPDPWAGQFYDAVGIIHEAVKKNDNKPDARQIGGYTRSLNSPQNAYHGITGTIYFDDTGDGAWLPVIGQISHASPPTWRVIGR